MSARFRVTSVDYEPADLAAQVPFEGTLLRAIPGPDRPDYWLAQLAKPLVWDDNGRKQSISHLILSARYEGQTIQRGFPRLTIGIAYVTDSSLLSDAKLDFAKCRYVAIGEAEGIKS